MATLPDTPEAQEQRARVTATDIASGRNRWHSNAHDGRYFMIDARPRRAPSRGGLARRDQETRWFYDPDRGVFVNAEGRELTETELRDENSHVMRRTIETALLLLALLKVGSIALLVWQTRMEALISDAYICGAGVGAGGWTSVSEWLTVSEMLTEQYAYLGGFAAEIEAGLLPLDSAAIQARVSLYISSSRTAYERYRLNEYARLGATHERRHRTKADSCEQCIEITAREWRPIGSLPLPGRQICLSNCGCWHSYGKMHDGKIAPFSPS